jgi:hypothetical protein
MKDNEFVCADCGTVFEESEYTFGGYLCSECSAVEFDEIDDFCRVSLEAHDMPSISAADDIDEGNYYGDDY